MTPREFISEVEDAWDKHLTQKQIQIYVRKLSRFNSWQLDELLERVLDDCKYRPKWAEIKTCAQELGYFREQETQARTTSAHMWEATSCQLCGGDGRLTVFFAVLYEETPEGRKTARRLRRIFRASDGGAILGYHPELDERAYLFRCSCSAGDAPSLPKEWPKWRNSDNEEEVPF